MGPMLTALQARLLEADQQAERKGIVWQTLRQMAGELDRLHAPYVVVGGVALQHHGIQRSTQDVDLLIGSIQELESIHARLVGHGYTRKSAESRHLRDEITRVRIEFLIAGEYPGDGKPKPVAFPKPEIVAERSVEGICFATLKTLIELKLASAKSAPHRIKDRADVLELIHEHSLTTGYAKQLNAYVQDEFLALAVLPPPSEPDEES